jgi:dATP pyrophosphohydrolase
MRQPLNVLVFLFRAGRFGPEYAVLRRADDGAWQAVAGGVEEGEDLLAAAQREVAQVTGLAGDLPTYKLDMVSGVQKTAFTASVFWPPELYIVPKHYFAMDVTRADSTMRLSEEHDTLEWLPYDHAYSNLKYDDDKTALWELNSRIWHRHLH